MTTLAQVLEAADKLSSEDRAELVEQLRKREVARRRQQIVAEIAESRREFAEGLAKVGTPDEIMQDILSGM